MFLKLTETAYWRDHVPADSQKYADRPCYIRPSSITGVFSDAQGAKISCACGNVLVRESAVEVVRMVWEAGKKQDHV